jgi:hypothetical protein
MPLHVAQRSQPLTEDEEAEFQLHPMRSLEVARDIGMTSEQLNGIIHHHERYDGLGYRMGLIGSEIPEFARLLAIADAYDRLTRPGPAGVLSLSMRQFSRCTLPPAATSIPPWSTPSITRSDASEQRAKTAPPPRTSARELTAVSAWGDAAASGVNVRPA